MPKRTDISSILIIGAGPIIIGQACEFDYSGTQAVKALDMVGLPAIIRPSFTLGGTGGAGPGRPAHRDPPQLHHGRHRRRHRL